VIEAEKGEGPAGIKHPLAVPGIAVFVIADIASFMLFFAVFMVDRMKAPAAFMASAAKLDVHLGLLNTLSLITSGWCVAQAENRHHFLPGSGRPWLRAAILIGSLFALLKILEYRAKIMAGIDPATDLFFTYYFVFTGIHLLHYIAGMIILSLLTLRRFSSQPAYGEWLRAGAYYWHMVDILWLFIFPLLYLQVAR
jgi:nitric oxide reductase NorE protein